MADDTDNANDAKPEGDDYSFLTPEQWKLVVDRLALDLRENWEGVEIFAPEFPEMGQEVCADFVLETNGFIWSNGGRGAPLSQLLLHRTRSEIHELDLAIAGLENTLKILKAYRERQQ